MAADKKKDTQEPYVNDPKKTHCYASNVDIFLANMHVHIQQFCKPNITLVTSISRGFQETSKTLIERETNAQEGRTWSFKEYCELLRIRFAYFQTMVEEYR